VIPQEVAIEAGLLDGHPEGGKVGRLVAEAGHRYPAPQFSHSESSFFGLARFPR
jgi:hypothetical protein